MTLTESGGGLEVLPFPAEQLERPEEGASPSRGSMSKKPDFSTWKNHTPARETLLIRSCGWHEMDAAWTMHVGLFNRMSSGNLYNRLTLRLSARS